MAVGADQGTLLTAGGDYRITWDHSTGSALCRYTIEDLYEGGTYVAYYSDGWRVAPAGHETADMEVLLGGGDPHWQHLVDALNRASGRAPVPGVHVW